MRGNSITYNGITLSLVKLNALMARAVYTDDGVDYLYTEYTLDALCTITPKETAYTGEFPQPVYSPNALPQETHTSIRFNLMQPRGELTFGVDDGVVTTLIDAPLEGYEIDANNGPFPREFTIIRIDGWKTIHCRYVIQFYMDECPFNKDAIISNRYSQSHDIDKDFYTIVRTHGVVYFRTDILDNAGVIADSFRDELLPEVPDGFKRDRINFGVNTQGNQIAYECVDIELPYELGNTGPDGSGSYITRAESNINLSTMRVQGGPPTPMCMATMTVRLWGAKPASTWIMSQLAFSVMSNQLPFGQKGVGYVSNFSVTKSNTERFVDVNVSMLLNPNQQGPFGQIRADSLRVDDVFGNFNGVNPSPPFDNGSRGPGGQDLAMISAALTDACTPPEEPGDLAATGSGGQASSRYATNTPSVSVEPVDLITAYQNKYSQPQLQIPYTESRIESRYETYHGTMQAPLTAPAPSSSSSSGNPSANNNSPSSSILSISMPMTRRIVDWTVERLDEKPELPEFNSSDQNQVLFKSIISPAAVYLLPDGVTHVFRVTGRYIYFMSQDMTQLSQLNYDVPHWVDDNYGDNSISLPPPTSGSGSGGTSGGSTSAGSDFISGLIDPGGSGGGSATGSGVPGP